MRHQLHRLNKINSTKSERKVSEILKRNHIPFKTKVKIENKEVDFLIGKVVFEIDGSVHKHIDTAREKMLFDAGYIPIHISIKEVYDDKIGEKILSLIKSNNGN